MQAFQELLQRKGYQQPEVGPPHHFGSTIFQGHVRLSSPTLSSWQSLYRCFRGWQWKSWLRAVLENQILSLDQDLEHYIVTLLLPILPLILHYESGRFCCRLFQPAEKQLISTPSSQQPSPPQSSVRPSHFPNRSEVPKPNILTCCLDKILHKLQAQGIRASPAPCWSSQGGASKSSLLHPGADPWLEEHAHLRFLYVHVKFDWNEPVGS